ncbi:MAG: ribonuclease P protein component [Campylobacterota bacterium]|nr:ribonuclease P protein component [Campylobacterota bacterium]
MDSLGGFNTLKLHKEFQRIYNKGKNQHSNSVVLFFLPQSGTKKIGFTATKKIGNAVKRNRAKRKLRAAFIQYSNSLKDGTYIFVAKHSLVESSHEQFINDFNKVIKRSRVFKENKE